MQKIIYRKQSGSQWIKQGDRLTKTFASGLCLIQQTYIAPKAIATYDAFKEGDRITDSQPCIDDAYIFPSPDYQDTNDGFIRCTITAYGRVNNTGNKTFSKELGVQEFSAAFIPVSGDPRGQNWFIDVLADKLVWKFITAKKTPSVNLNVTEQLRIFRLNGNELSSVQISEFFSTSTFAGIDKNDSVSFLTPNKIILAEAQNYGAFDEWTVAYRANPSRVSLGIWQETSAPSVLPDYEPVVIAPKNSSDSIMFNFGLQNNGAEKLTTISIKNIEANNVSSPFKLIPISGMPVETYLGGSAFATTKSGGEFNFIDYTLPVIERPDPIIVFNSIPPDSPGTVKVGKFTFNRLPGETVSNGGSDGGRTTYNWKMVPAYEIFEITVENENGQQGKSIKKVLFTDDE